MNEDQQTNEMTPNSCLLEDQSGGVGHEALDDNEEARYGIYASGDIAEEAEAMMADASAEVSVSAPGITRYYQGRACSRAKRTKADINKVLIHTPEGGEAGTLSVLNGTGASFDWFLPLNGNLYRCNDYSNFIAWQAGNWPVNQTSIGIEQGDYASRSGSFGDAHYHRLARLCAWLAETLDLNIRRTRDKNSYGFISHADVTPGMRTDPGAGFLWDKLMDLTLDYRRGTSTKPEPDELFKVQSGAFREKKNADGLASEMKKRGFETYIVEENGLYKVQTGAFANESNARAHERHVERAGFDAFVTMGKARPR